MKKNLVDFTDKEFSYLKDTDFLLTKAEITEKVIHLFEHTKEVLQQVLLSEAYVFPEGTDSSKGKISRGENYKSLPWIILDYPKLFKADSFFSLRTLFLWGREFSCTLHLQHKALEENRRKILERYKTLSGEGFFVCVNSTPWEYHYAEANYRELDKFSGEEIESLILEKPFLKLNRKLDLDNYKMLPSFADESFRLIMQLFS